MPLSSAVRQRGALTPRAGLAKWWPMKRRLGVLLLAPCALSCGTRSSEPPLALDPAASHYGKTYVQWAGEWERWIYEMRVSTDCETPISDATGASCARFQDDRSPVSFLVGNFGGVVRRTECALPRGKPLFVPIIVSFQDNGGVPRESWKTDLELERSAEAQGEGITQVTFSLDGRSLAPLDRYAIRAARYEYTLPPEPNVFSCQGAPVTGSYAGYTSGYFVMVPPLDPGSHRIEFTAKASPQGLAPFSLDVIYDLLVIR